jgi:hypothetical protein
LGNIFIKKSIYFNKNKNEQVGVYLPATVENFSKFETNGFSKNIIINNNFNLICMALKSDKSNFIGANKSNFFSRDLLLLSSGDEILKSKFFKKQQLISGKRLKPAVKYQNGSNVRL